MNRLYIFLCLACLSLAGCHEVTVGYLRADHAEYPIDSLCIYDAVNVQKQIDELEQQKMSPRDSLLIARDSLKNLGHDKSMESSAYFFATLRPLELKLEGIDSVANRPYFDEVKAEFLVAKAKYDKMEEEVENINYEYQEVMEKLDNLDPGSDLVAESVQEKLKSLNARLKKEIAWTTSEIEGVDGTAPLIFEIAGVWAEEGGDAGMFREELKIHGGGWMEVPFENRFPAGRYHVSVRVKNEGYSRTLENAFTFIVVKE